MSKARTDPEALDEPARTNALEIPRRVTHKTDWPERAERIISRLRDQYDEVVVYVLIKQMVEILEAAVKNQKDRALNAMPYKKTGVMGAIVEMRNLPPKFEYDDEELKSLEVQLIAIKGQIKARQKFLESFNEETVLPGGEIVKPAKKISEGATIVVTFPA